MQGFTIDRVTISFCRNRISGYLHNRHTGHEFLEYTGWKNQTIVNRTRHKTIMGDDSTVNKSNKCQADKARLTQIYVWIKVQFFTDSKRSTTKV